jgi:hypothetical protein
MITTLEQRREAERQKYLKLQPTGYGGTNHGKRAMATVLSWQPRFVVDFGGRLRAQRLHPITDTCGMAMLLARMPWNQIRN